MIEATCGKNRSISTEESDAPRRGCRGVPLSISRASMVTHEGVDCRPFLKPRHGELAGAALAASNACVLKRSYVARPGLRRLGSYQGAANAMTALDAHRVGAQSYVVERHCLHVEPPNGRIHKNKTGTVNPLGLVSVQGRHPIGCALVGSTNSSSFRLLPVFSAGGVFPTRLRHPWRAPYVPGKCIRERGGDVGQRFYQRLKVIRVRRDDALCAPRHALEQARGLKTRDGSLIWRSDTPHLSASVRTEGNGRLVFFHHPPASWINTKAARRALVASPPPQTELSRRR